MDKISLYAVGDVRPNRPDPDSYFKGVLPTFKKADILFGQLEAPFTTKCESQVAFAPVTYMDPANASALTAAGFDVMSFASNHTLDCGAGALLETMETMKKNKIPLIGVGKNIEEARKPLILERKGIKVAFLAYCSVLPKGYEAGPERPGAAPVRASTFYEQVDWQPGTPSRVVTLANKDDLAAMVSDIKRVKRLADIVVLSIHWGIHFVPELLAMYQKEVGYAAIDAGVDLILGHHAHILKGVEIYKGKVIFYSLCNLLMISAPGRKTAAHKLYGVKEDPEYLDYGFPVDSRKTMIARCIISGNKIEQVSFLPAYINRDARPEVLTREDRRFDEVVKYMKEITESQNLNAKYTIKGDEVIISA